MFDIALRKRIMDLYRNDSDIANKLLAGDDEAIRHMLRECEMTDEMVIYAYEHNKVERILNPFFFL